MVSHTNVIKFDNRPFGSVEEMNSALIERWNNAVSNTDTVYILGDWIWCKPNSVEYIEIVSALNGSKDLILGNHDPKSVNKELCHAAKLMEITPYKEITDNQKHVIMCHYPIPFHKGAYNENCYMLYGHVHNTREWDFVEKFRKEVRATCKNRGDARGQFINVGACMTYMDYTPRTLEEIIEGEKAVCI